MSIERRWWDAALEAGHITPAAHSRAMVLLDERREIGQILIEAIGSPGPEDAIDTARRAAALLARR